MRMPIVPNIPELRIIDQILTCGPSISYIRLLFSHGILRSRAKTSPRLGHFVYQRLLMVVGLLLSASACSGCVSTLGGIIVAAPNVHKPQMLKSEDGRPLPESLLGVDDYFRVRVGPPAASLSVSVLEPHDAEEPPRGTILVLHGMGARSAWMHGKADALAAHGYRAVLVDLRGHGASSGSLLTYGLREARDLSYVVDELEARNLLSGRLGVMGISYGAASGLHLAAIDRRVAAVVAIAPFSDMRSEVSHYVRTIGLPGVGPFLAEETIQDAVDEAGEIGGFDPDRADAALAMRQTNAAVLLIHGRADLIIPDEHSQRLHEAAPDRSELMLLPASGHVTIWVDPLRRVRRASLRWFDEHL